MRFDKKDMDKIYTLHCEMQKDGVWYNWDLYRFRDRNKYDVIPVIEGENVLGETLSQYELLSKKIARDQVSPNTLEAHPTQFPEEQDWRVFDYVKFFNDHDFSKHETNGYFARGIVDIFRKERDYSILETARQSGGIHLSAQEYESLTPESQKNFEFYEYTNPSSRYGIMRSIQQAVETRLYHTDYDAVRIVILVS